MSDALTAKSGALFIQKTPGKAAEYLGCLDLDPISEPTGDVTVINCRDQDGNFMTVGSSTDAPKGVKTAVKALAFAESDILDTLGSCLVNLYALSHVCGKAGVFSNYVRGLIVHHSKITTKTWENVVMREADDPMTRSLDIQAWNPVYQIRQLVVARQSIAETTDLTDIAFCNSEQCAGDCGSDREAGQDGVIVGEAPAGSPTERADVWSTDDGGTIWDNIPGGAAHPFVSGQDIMSVVCYPIDAITTRWLVAREQVVAEPLKVAYSDDGGATWTLVTVGSTNNEGAAGQGALFALDSQHIWLCTTAGEVYFSSDAGVTWTSQSAVTPSGGSSLNVVDFADADNGYAVGDTGAIIGTVDGGATWTAKTDPSSGADLTALHTFNRYRLIVGTDADGIYESWDATANWESKNFSGKVGTGTVKAFDFVNDLVGFMVADTAAPVGSVHRSIDGGHSWEKLTTPTNAGLNAVEAINENLAYCCGNAVGGTGFVAKISG